MSRYLTVSLGVLGLLAIAKLGLALAADGAALRPAAAAPAAAASDAPAGWKLVWSDEFDGAQIDRKKWDFDRGSYLPSKTGDWQPGWGNGEQEFYTPRPENAFLKDGMLH